MAGALLALGALALPVPTLAQAASESPSPATVAMRWQWLNPEINAFTFRETSQVFEYRPVSPHGERWVLPAGAPMACRAEGNESAVTRGTVRPSASVILGSV